MRFLQVLPVPLGVHALPKQLFHYCFILFFLSIPSWNFVAAMSFGQEPRKVLQELEAHCVQNGILVNLLFSRPFGGVAYSEGHYDTARCRYINQGEPFYPSYSPTEPNKGTTNFTFLIPLSGCGTVKHEGNADPIPKSSKMRWKDDNNENDVYIQNTLLIQNDAAIQEEGDVARTLRCVFPKNIHQPLMASLPIGNGKGVYPGSGSTRRKNVSSSSSPGKVGNYEQIRLQKIDSSGYNTFWQLQGKKKGHVQSIPFANGRRQYSRALKSVDKSSTEVENPQNEYPDPGLPMALKSSSASKVSQLRLSSLAPTIMLASMRLTS